MNRTDRLYSIVETLRQAHGMMTAKELATAHDCSVRTIYRDVADLTASGVPIDGEPGLGYTLRSAQEVPPLMFTAEEVEMIVEGLQALEHSTDERRVRAAHDALEKIERALPAPLRPLTAEGALSGHRGQMRLPLEVDLDEIKAATRRRHKLMIAYRDDQGTFTRRVVRPLALGFYAKAWLLVAWCELRDDFRIFRVHRIERCARLDDTFLPEPGKGLDDFLRREDARHR